jgi:hypothetical protein
VRQEQRRQRQDNNQAGDDEAHAADDGADRTGQSPRTKDRELRRCRPRQQRRRRDPVLELGLGQPRVLLDAQPAQQRNVRRRPAEAGDADAAPFARDDRQAYPLRVQRGLGLAWR